MNKKVEFQNCTIAIDNEIYYALPKKLVSFVKEQNKEIEKLNNIIDETLKELEKIGDFYTTPAGEVIHLKDKIYHINKAINKLKEGKE